MIFFDNQRSHILDLGLIDIVAEHAGNKAHIDFVADLFFVNISAGNDGSNIYTMCVFP